MDKFTITLEAYNIVAKQYKEKFTDFTLYHPTYDLFCNLISKNCAVILDVGCGPGLVTKYLLQQRADFKILAIDVSTAMIELAKQECQEVDFRVMDCREITTINKNFDGVMCAFCLPYLTKDDIEKLLREISSMLNANGILYLSTMEGDEEKSGYETTSFSGENKLYIHYHEEDFLINCLTSNNFNITHIEKLQYPEKDGTFSTDIVILAQKIDK